VAIVTRDLVAEALAAWIVADLGRYNDFAREGLPDCGCKRLLTALGSSSAFKAGDFSIALVGFDMSDTELKAAADSAGLQNLAGTTTDLHIATEWRNSRSEHSRIIALARGYNPSVHGLSFFGRATSSQLATHLLRWAKEQREFTVTPQHRALLDVLLIQPGLQALRSLEGMASFLECWSSSKPASINSPRDALPKLGLLPDPRLFEASDLARQLESNLQLRELVTVMAPGEVRQRRKRAERLPAGARRKSLLQSLARLDAFRRSEADDLTFEDAELIVRPPAEVPLARESLEEIVDQNDQGEAQPDIMHEAVDALLDGRQEDLDSIGLALEAAWEEFEINGERIAATAQTTRGTVSIDLSVDPKLLDWVVAFCSVDRFGGLLETDVIDLRQALDRYAEWDPIFIDPSEIWKHNGQTRSIEQLLAGWDGIDAVKEGQRRPLVETWLDFIRRRAVLAEDIKQLLIHPREWLDTHALARENCKAYIAVAAELYGAIQRHYQTVWDRSRDWAQATLDAILSLDIVQVRIKAGTRTSAKAVMLPLHPLHLWRYQRLGEVLRDFTRAAPLSDADREALIEELQRPEQFLSVIRTGGTPAGRGLNQLLPVSNDIQGLATFENLHNAVSSADGVNTLVQALDHYVSLYPNHPRPLRLALVNPPEPTKILEQIVKLLNERRHTNRLLGIAIDIFATTGHKDRLAAASALEGSAQDLIYEKVASSRLELRVAAHPATDMASLVKDRFDGRSFHVVALFDESAISIRRRRVERLLPMSPFCVRNEIIVDDLLGDISLSPHPGEPPFSDFVLMIQEMEREQRDSTMFASADADTLRAIVDKLVLGPEPLTNWVLLADRALPPESGMQSVRLLERKEGQRQVLLSAADHGRLASLMNAAFQECNLTVPANLDELLRQGVNLVGAGLLDMIKKQTGQPDSAKVIGFVGMLLAARDVLARKPNSLIASVDARVARLWLRLGPRQTADRCDLLAVSADQEGNFQITCIEVKTTLDPLITDEDERIKRAAAQIANTAAVVESALVGEDAFSAPRLEMLKEILVRAAAARWGDETSDAERRRTWGPSLKKLFGQSGDRPPVRVDGEIILIKLRSVDRPSHYPLVGATVKTSIRVITEPLAEELLDGSANALGSMAPDPSVRPRDVAPSPRSKARRSVTNVEGDGSPARPVHANGPVRTDGGLPPLQDSTHLIRPTVIVEPQDSVNTGEPEVWPPAVNALGMVGQFEVARELADLARKAKGWGERFPDKLLVGPAGVGKSSLARRVSEQLLGLEPILFNGADLRRPEMIIERLTELKKVPARPKGNISVDACLIFIDEVHAIHTTVATALLSALDDRRTTTVGNVVYNFDKVVFLLATTDPGRLTEAFLSRPTKTTLRSYSLEEMAGIVWLHGKDTLDGASLSRETCVEVAARMQCSPRPSVNILNPLVAYFYGVVEKTLNEGVPSRTEVASCMTVGAVGSWFTETLGIDSNGLGPLHIDYLKVLKSRGAAPEDEIRRSLGISNRNDFVEVSEYITRLGLIQVGPGGRSLTADGRRYLTSQTPPDLRARISRRGA
jgi:Holliday junction resolvasome RuvABC ATP-dependent DNA helicase subunit